MHIAVITCLILTYRFNVCSNVTEIIEAPTAAASSAASRGRLLLLLAPYMHAEPTGGVQLLRPTHPGGQERPLQAVQLCVDQERKALSKCRSQNGQARGVRGSETFMSSWDGIFM